MPAPGLMSYEELAEIIKDDQLDIDELPHLEETFGDVQHDEQVGSYHEWVQHQFLYDRDKLGTRARLANRNYHSGEFVTYSKDPKYIEFRNSIFLELDALDGNGTIQEYIEICDACFGQLNQGGYEDTTFEMWQGGDVGSVLRVNQLSHALVALENAPITSQEEKEFVIDHLKEKVKEVYRFDDGDDGITAYSLVLAETMHSMIEIDKDYGLKGVWDLLEYAQEEEKKWVAGTYEFALPTLIDEVAADLLAEKIVYMYKKIGIEVEYGDVRKYVHVDGLNAQMSSEFTFEDGEPSVPFLARYKTQSHSDVKLGIIDQIPHDAVVLPLFSEEEVLNAKDEAKQIEEQNSQEEWGQAPYLDHTALYFSSYNMFYYEHDAVLDVFSRKELWKDDEATGAQALAKLLTYNSMGHVKKYVRAFEDLGAEYAVTHLLKNLKHDDEVVRRMSAEILFNLELGKVGVTEQGAEYLGKLYDLGTYNDPEFFVRRLNSSGLMAVLTEEEGNIEGVFALDLFAEEDIVQAEVRQLMSQELFLPKADETPHQRQQREKYLELFLQNYESIFNDDFFEGTGVRLNSLDLHEQGWFLLTYLELSHQEAGDDLDRLKGFVKDYGEYGLKSFLALEYGGSGAEILEFAESSDLAREEKLQIFKDFYGVANEAMHWRDVFGKAEAIMAQEFAPQVHEAFIRKNAEFFKAAQMIARGEGGDVPMWELASNMRTVAFALRALRGVYEDDSNLVLEQPPQSQDEYDAQGNLVENASSTYILIDKSRGARVVVSMRPQPTVKKGEVNGGEARINFNVTNLHTDQRARIGFDLSDYGQYIGKEDNRPVLSLDLGVGKPDREAGIWPSQRVGRVLELVEGSEGGHNELSFRPEVAEHFPEVAEAFRQYVHSKFASAEDAGK